MQRREKAIVKKRVTESPVRIVGTYPQETLLIFHLGYSLRPASDEHGILDHKVLPEV